ncbi:unnamed protein product [Albugo candida]|uniref:Uncharacterized protein n=1 Tax=Albugo candida TaxID=65357 RepID=A0A024G8B9_9STRA|nr:unnamed protein product [Albugo candida]|eukprot:CCI42993.1 unnamed protein product [Albugo candida]
MAFCVFTHFSLRFVPIALPRSQELIVKLWCIGRYLLILVTDQLSFQPGTAGNISQKMTSRFTDIISMRRKRYRLPFDELRIVNIHAMDPSYGRYCVLFNFDIYTSGWVEQFRICQH